VPLEQDQIGSRRRGEIIRLLAMNHLMTAGHSPCHFKFMQAGDASITLVSQHIDLIFCIHNLDACSYIFDPIH
jgi:hypothetical protein